VEARRPHRFNVDLHDSERQSCADLWGRYRGKLNRPKTMIEANSNTEVRQPAPDGRHQCLVLPRPLFSCSIDGCQEEVSYHADQLFWYEQDKNWVCENCWDDLPRIGDEDEGEVPERGVSLEAHILGLSLSAADLLQNVRAVATEGAVIRSNEAENLSTQD
jgi:hypothetical protein